MGSEHCECDLRNRAWNPNTGKCETCKLAYPRPARPTECECDNPNHGECDFCTRRRAEAHPLSGVSAKRMGDRPTLRASFYRAEDLVGRDRVPDAVITISGIIPIADPGSDSIDAYIANARERFASQARGLFSALRASLPGGTLDALLVEMLAHRASILTIPAAPADSAHDRTARELSALVKLSTWVNHAFGPNAADRIIEDKDPRHPDNEADEEPKDKHK